MKRCASLVVALAMVVLTEAPLLPCCMIPRTYKGTISQSQQEAVLFHHDGREELVLKINYKIQGEGLPGYFAWVITVPNEPDQYATAEEKLFEEVFEWAEPLTRRPARSDSGARVGAAAGDAALGLEFGKTARVGPYDIQSVRALGREALTGLNDWLTKNGFPTEDPKHMEYFVDKKFTFLCVKVVPGTDRKGAKEKAVAAKGDLPPLHLSFKSESPYYPLRFSSRQGVFDVNLYVLTQEKFDYEKSSESLKKIRFSEEDLLRNVTVKPDSLPPGLKKVFAKSKWTQQAATWRLNVFRTRRVNEGNTIAGWAEDIFFRTRV